MNNTYRKARGAIALASAVALAIAMMPALSLAPAKAAQAQQRGALELTALDESLESFTLPVEMMKLKDPTSVSMAAPLLYKTAFAKRTESGYSVTVYFVNATIMASTIYAGSLGQATYDKAGDGVMVPADKDVYDKSTQVKSVTMTVESLDAPLKIDLQMMDAVNLVFDTSAAASATSGPAFKKITVSTNEFPYYDRFAIGGSGVDDVNSMALLPNGCYVFAGSTTSSDQDFSDRPLEDESSFVALYSSDGDILSTSYLSGAQSIGCWSVAAAPDSSYYVCGMIQNSDKVAATGDFAGIELAGTEGTRNGFVAKYNANGKLQWVRGISGSNAVQCDGIAATPDGGCITMVEMLVPSGYTGSFEGELTGIISCVAVKYAADGTEDWHAVIGGSSGTDTDGAVAVYPDGSCIITGQFMYNATGMLSGLESYGGTFDLFAIKLDKDGKKVFAQSYGGTAVNEATPCVTTTSDGGFAFVGSTSSADGTFADDPAVASNGFIVKCDKDGNVQWAHTIKSSKANEATYVAETSDGFVVAGSGAGADREFTNLAKGQDDGYVATYNTEGQRTSIRTFGGSLKDYAKEVAALEDGRYAVLLSSASSDIDMAKIARGKTDGVLVVTGPDATVPEEPQDTPPENDPTPAPAPVTPGTQQETGKDTQVQQPAQTPTVPVTAATVNAKKVTRAAVKKALGANAATVTKVMLGKKVKSIKAKAFAGTKVTTLVVKTKKLTKKSVKGALKGSKVKTVKVPKAKKKLYKKIFVKKVAGKKVKVK